jgi:hypothetical protein
MPCSEQELAGGPTRGSSSFASAAGPLKPTGISQASKHQVWSVTCLGGFTLGPQEGLRHLSPSRETRAPSPPPCGALPAPFTFVPGREPQGRAGVGTVASGAVYWWRAPPVCARRARCAALERRALARGAARRHGVRDAAEWRAHGAPGRGAGCPRGARGAPRAAPNVGVQHMGRPARPPCPAVAACERKAGIFACMGLCPSSGARTAGPRGLCSSAQQRTAACCPPAGPTARPL